MRAVATIAWREIRQFLADRTRLAATILQPVLFGIILGLGFGGSIDVGQGQSYAQYLVPGMISMLVLFTGMYGAISVIEDKQSGFLRTVMASPVTDVQIAMGQTLGVIGLAFLQLVPIIILLWLVGWITPNASIGSWSTLLVVIVSMSALFSGVSHALAWKSKSTRGFHAIVNLVLIPAWLLSGAIFPQEGIRPPLSYLADGNPVSHAITLLRGAVSGDAVVTSLSLLFVIVSGLLAFIWHWVSIRKVRNG